MSKSDYFKDKNNVGGVFKNHNKTNDKAPDFTGNAKVNGVMYRVVMWENEKNLSMKFQSEEEAQQYKNNNKKTTVEQMENDPPF